MNTTSDKTMKGPLRFTLNEIEEALKTLNIQFSSHASTNSLQYSFKSLKRIEESGIYFFVDESKTHPKIENSIILCQSSPPESDSNIRIHVKNPQLTFYKLMESMLMEPNRPPGIHHTAVVGENCFIDPTAYIGPFCVLEDCTIKAGAKLHSHVTVMRGTMIEENVTIESHSTIGATGVAWVWDPDTRRRVIQPQIGFTTIGRESFLGSDITVVRGSVNETTSIGEGCVIAHGSKIGHGSQIGAECHLANNVSIAGNVTLGERCFLGSGAVIRPQTRLAERTVVGAGAVVVKNLDEPDIVLVGSPAKPKKTTSSKMSGVPKPLTP